MVRMAGRRRDVRLSSRPYTRGHQPVQGGGRATSVEGSPRRWETRATGAISPSDGPLLAHSLDTGGGDRGDDALLRHSRDAGPKAGGGGR